MEVMISLVIGMLLVLVIYQVYEISEGQKRTITTGSDAQQNASYAAHVIGRDISMAGNGIASTAPDLYPCVFLRPIPVLIEPGATDDDPDKITVFYGGSSSLSTAVPMTQNAAGAQPYRVPSRVGFSAHPTDDDKSDLIAAVQGPNCTVSRINRGGVAIDPATGLATISHTPLSGNLAGNYNSGLAMLVNLGQEASMGRIEYTVDAVDHVLRMQNRLPTDGPVNPVINDVVALKAQYGVNANCDGVLVWKSPTDAGWSLADVQAMPLPSAPPFCVAGTPSLRQIQAIRIAIVTRSAQYEKEVVTPQLPAGMPAGKLGLFCDSALTCAVTMDMTRFDTTHAADYGHYRYKVLETAIPLRNALWNTQ
jgi:type IV pilus assembly protein PilW